MLRRTGFNRKAIERAPVVLTALPMHLRRSASYARADMGNPVSVEKPPRADHGVAERQHKERLVLMGCLVCRRLFGPHEPGPVELHHLRGGGWGKGDWTTLIPLCAEHHRGSLGVHGLGTKGFPKHYGFDQADLLADVQRLIDGGGVNVEA